MSQVYPEDLLHNTKLQHEARSLYKAGFINPDQLQSVKSGLQALNTQHNLFARLGLFLFTFFLINASLTFLAFISGIGEKGIEILPLVISAASFLSLEYFIKTKQYFNFGVDNAFLFSGILLLLLFIALETNFNNGSTVCIVAMAAGIICSYRYVDGFSALVTCMGFTGLIVNTCMKAGNIGQSLLPFAAMAAAGIIFLIYRLLNNIKGVAETWEACLHLAYVFSIILFYAAGNYMVVRIGREELIGIPVADGGDIPMAWLFYVFTILVPITYIYTGLHKRNKALLQTGIVALAFGVYSIRYYHQVLPVEWGLIIAGSILFAIAYYCIKLLKNRTAGIVFSADRFTNNDNVLNTEALIIAEGLKPEHLKQHSEPTFGGGQFGGGGAEGNF